MRLTTISIAVFASLVASILVSGCVEQNEYRGVHPRWTHAINDLRSLRATITGVRDGYPAISDCNAVNRWLATNDDSEVGLARKISYDANLDPWERPYVFVERGASSDEMWDRVHLYSLGEDGASTTSGNDVDDINTWDEESFHYYVRRDNQATVQRHLKRLAWMFPLFTACGLATVRIARSRATRGPEQ